MSICLDKDHHVTLCVTTLFVEICKYNRYVQRLMLSRLRVFVIKINYLTYKI